MSEFHNGVSATLITTPWVKSQKSNENGQCVELSQPQIGKVAVRNSTDPAGPALVFTTEEIDAFLDGAQKGEFDHLRTTN
ncbi:DUF397 domain-containing protein [Streptomyces sp. NPDC004111]|uniref:DUF397 domain-containing protein n=1 Tax=Streptomyces sp. NPDC004111 TaxID=3364690 RepID=UPI0036D13DCA